MPLILGVFHLPLNLGDSLLLSAKNCQPTALLMLQLMLEASMRGWAGGKGGGGQLLLGHEWRDWSRGGTKEIGVYL